MKFHGTCLYVDDVEGALAFYNRAFGFTTRHYDADMKYGELDTGETTLAFAAHDTATELTQGAHKRSADGQPSGVEVAIVTPDVQDAFERALAEGATVVAEPRVMPWGWTMAYVQSVEGTLIGLGCPPEEANDGS